MIHNIALTLFLLLFKGYMLALVLHISIILNAILA